MADYSENEMRKKTKFYDSLNKFSSENYTYINQIFGDESVREKIMELYKHKTYKLFAISPSGIGEFADSDHHVINVNQKRNLHQICSVKMGIQNMSVNVNDTLCQSYSLLLYLREFHEFVHLSFTQGDSIGNQMDIIKMYRILLQNSNLTDFLKDYISNYDVMWIDYTDESEPLLKPLYSGVNSPKLIQKINQVLDEWQDYGYNFFIRDPKKEYTNYKTKYNALKKLRGGSSKIKNTKNTKKSITKSKKSIRNSKNKKK